MIPALYILAALVTVGTVLYILHRIQDARMARNAPADQDKPEPELAAESEDSECCGMHITCEKDSLLAAVSRKIEYYDDEELDAYAGRKADEYSDSEIEQFRDVLLTLLPQDIAGWGRSLQLRGITLPYDVREELLMIVAEQRRAATR